MYLSGVNEYKELGVIVSNDLSFSNNVNFRFPYLQIFFRLGGRKGSQTHKYKRWLPNCLGMHKKTEPVNDSWTNNNKQPQQNRSQSFDHRNGLNQI